MDREDGGMRTPRLLVMLGTGVVGSGPGVCALNAASVVSSKKRPRWGSNPRP